MYYWRTLRARAKRGDVINVSDGYGRNYLIARGLAAEPTAQLNNDFSGKRSSQQFKIDTETQAARDNAAKLDGKTFEMRVKGGESGKLFGSVTSKEIAELIKTNTGVDIDKKKVDIDTIKSIRKLSRNA